MADTTTTTSAIGQQTPYTSNTEFGAICFLVRQLVALLDTMLPAQVIAVHPGSGSPPAAGTVDVQLLISQLDGAGNATPSGNVYGLPYFRVKGGPWAIICDPAENDIGLVICASRDISNLVAAVAGGNSPLVNPGSFRKYNVADGVYMGGFVNEASTAWIWLKTDGTFAIQDKPGNILATSSTGIAATPVTGMPFTVNGSLVVTENLQLEGGIQSQTGGIYGGNLETSGNVIAGVGSGSVGLLTHKHAQPNDSHGDAEQPTAAPTSGT